MEQKKMAAKKTTNPTSTTNSPGTQKPGIRSTEFWLCSFCALLSILWGAGVLDLGSDADGNVNRAAGLIAGALSALGYGVSRGLAKINPNK
tara:strand:- start:1175 stop:1447 length:273 start_codon:yes stop_codon:yes gene_type:complete